jgi:TetR/AcrR family transcriptional regulator, regulator of mycofactocin system
MIGRPPATSHAEIEAAAFALFARQGFAETTLDDIARAVGVGRRTIFRYYPSKNDIIWGQFDESLAGFRSTLQGMPVDLPVFEAVHLGIIEFNRFDSRVMDQHRERMSLILRTPELQAHSALRYQQWRHVIAEYVAGRLGQDADDIVPITAGRVGLALALSAYESWLSSSRGSLEAHLRAAFSGLSDLLGSGD